MSRRGQDAPAAPPGRRAVHDAWRALWERAPRQLRVTQSGKLIVGIALAAGFAAINTGNNLLFLVWGLLLSSIIISGLLSEAALRPLDLALLGQGSDLRAGESCTWPVCLRNTSRHLPSFALNIDVALTAPDASTLVAPGSYQLRLEPDEARTVTVRLRPLVRGPHRIDALVSRTAYPFGFFEKSRRFLPVYATVYVPPARVDVRSLVARFTGTLGETPAAQVGRGDDFFALRPLRTGDDPRRIHWRRTARTGRPVVTEAEAYAGQEVMLDVVLAGTPRTPGSDAWRWQEHTLATAASLVEALLLRDLRVGLRAPGVLLAPGRGAQQLRSVLHGLARLQPQAPTPRWLAPPTVTRIALCELGDVDGAAYAAVLRPPSLENEARS